MELQNAEVGKAKQPAYSLIKKVPDYEHYLVNSLKALLFLTKSGVIHL